MALRYVLMVQMLNMRLWCGELQDAVNAKVPDDSNLALRVDLPPIDQYVAPNMGDPSDLDYDEILKVMNAIYYYHNFRTQVVQMREYGMLGVTASIEHPDVKAAITAVLSAPSLREVVVGGAKQCVTVADDAYAVLDHRIHNGP